MDSSHHSLPHFILILFFTFSSLSSTHKIPRLGLLPRTTTTTANQQLTSSDTSHDLNTFFYTQTLDHFNYRPDSYTTFQQRYIINFKYWGGTKTSSPIFVYLGCESAIDGDVDFIGFLPDNAPRFKALLVYIEVRFIPITLCPFNYILYSHHHIV